MNIVKKITLIIVLKITAVAIIFGALIVLIMGGVSLLMSLIPPGWEMGLAYDKASNFYSVPLKITPGVGTVYTPLSDFKTYDENASTLGELKINGMFLANKKLKIVDKYLFMSSFVPSDFETMLSGKDFYKLTYTGVIIGGYEVDRTVYVIKTGGSGSGNSVGNYPKFSLYTGYDAMNDQRKYMADSLNFLKRTDNDIRYYYFNFETSKRFGFLYPYRMSYGVVLENGEGQNISSLGDYSITDTALGGPFEMFSTRPEDSIVQSMTVCEPAVGKGKPVCYQIPKQDTFEEGNRFYFKNQSLLGKEKDFESVYYLQYSYTTIAGKKYTSSIRAIPKTFNADKDYVSILDKSFFKNSGGKMDVFEKDRILSTSDKEYLISESLRIMPKYFYIDPSLRRAITKDVNANDKFEYVPTERSLILNMHPYLFIHSFYQNYVANEDNLGVKIRSTGFSPSPVPLDTYSFIKDVGYDTIKQLGTFSDQGVFSYSTDSDSIKMKKDFQKNLDLVISGFDYSKAKRRNGNTDGSVPIVLLSKTEKPKDSTFFGLAFFNDEVEGLEYSMNLLSVYGLFYHPVLNPGGASTPEQQQIRDEYAQAFTGAKIEEKKSFWEKAQEVATSNIGNDFFDYMGKRIFNPFQSIGDDVSQSTTDVKNAYRTYSCDYTDKLATLSTTFNGIKDTVKTNYGNEQIDKILFILSKNGVVLTSELSQADEKRKEIGNKQTELDAILVQFNTEQDSGKKDILQKTINNLRLQIDALQKEVSANEEGTSKKIDDIITKLKDEISMKESYVKLLREKITGEGRLPDTDTSVIGAVKEIGELKANLADLSDVKANYETDIEKTFSILVAFQKYEELLKEVTVLENCMLSGNDDGIFAKKSREAQEEYIKNKSEIEGHISGLQKNLSSKMEELSTLSKSLNMNDESAKERVIYLNGEIKTLSDSIAVEVNKKASLLTIKNNAISKLIEEYGSDQTIKLNYRNDRNDSTMKALKEKEYSKMREETATKIQTLGNDNATKKISSITEMKSMASEYRNIVKEISDLESNEQGLRGSLSSETDEAKKAELSAKIEQIGKELSDKEAKKAVFNTQFDNIKKDSGLDIGRIDNVTDEYLNSSIKAIETEVERIKSLSGAVDAVANSGSVIFNSADREFAEMLYDESFKKQVIQDLKTGNFDYYHVAYDNAYVLSTQSESTLGFLGKMTGDFLSDKWTHGGNKDLALYYNLHVFYKGIIDLKEEVGNNTNIVTGETYPLRGLKSRFGTFGRFFFPNVSEGEFIIDDLGEYERLAGLKSSLSQNAAKIQELRNNLKKYLEAMSIDSEFTGSGRYADYMTNMSGSLVYKEILNETNVRFIKEHADKFDYTPNSQFLSGGTSPSDVIGIFTDHALNMQVFYNDVKFRGLGNRSKIDALGVEISDILERLKTAGVIDTATLNTSMIFKNREREGLIESDIKTFDTYYRAYLMSIYRKLLIAKYVEGYESAISSDLVLQNQDALQIYQAIVDAQNSASSDTTASYDVLNGQKRAFNKAIEGYKGSICGSYSDADTKQACVGYMDYLEKMPDVKTFLEEVEYSASVTKLAEAHGWIFPRTRDFITVRASLPPYDKLNGGLVGQCVWYIQVKKDAKGGNASTWGKQGIVVNPKGDFLGKLQKNDVVVFSEGDYGHIAIVEEVDEKANKVRISESNYGRQGKITVRWIPADSWLIKHYIVGIKDKYRAVE